MAIARSTLLQEPGLLVFGSTHIYSAGEITVSFIEETLEVPVDVFGPVDERPIDRRIEITMTPCGELEALAVLFPLGGLDLGESPFGTSDATAVIFTPSGKSLTVHNAAVTSMPNLILAHDKTLFGEITITGLLKNSTDPTDSAAYFTWVASGASYPGDANFAVSSIKTLGYKGAWGSSSPWDVFYTEGGFSVNFSPSFENVPADGHGTIDMRLSGLSVEVSAIPVGIAPADVFTKRKFQGSGNALGSSKVGSDNLVITNAVGSSQLYFSLNKPVLKESPTRFGSSVRGVGELVWRATRTITTGTADPLFYLGTAAP
jgi:hypothetical protein